MSHISRCLIALLWAACVGSAGQGSGNAADVLAGNRFQEQKQNTFRYVIVGDELQGEDGTAPAQRTIAVLMDEADFSEEVLKSLFILVSKRFPSPAWLEVEVFTNVTQLLTPEEYDEGQMSERKPDDRDAAFDRHHFALLMRIGENELFRYDPNPPSRQLKTVILKGRDPFDSSGH